jgi:hypothetical protein
MKFVKTQILKQKRQSDRTSTSHKFRSLNGQFAATVISPCSVPTVGQLKEIEAAMVQPVVTAVPDSSLVYPLSGLSGHYQSSFRLLALYTLEQAFDSERQSSLSPGGIQSHQCASIPQSAWSSQPAANVSILSLSVVGKK